MYGVKRLVYLLHRWLGIVLCAFFAMWFFSGIVMMYVGYPKLTVEERLAHLPPLDAAQPYLAPAAALAAAGVEGPMADLRLAVASRGRAVYLVQPLRQLEPGRRMPPGQGTVVVDAVEGARLGAPAPADVLASAAAYAGFASSALRYDGMVREDAFTHSRGLDAHRPLHLVQLPDAEGTRLYISGTTGEVVRDAPRAERLWNYAGAWIHWLYPFRGNVFDRWWADIVNGLSVVGIVLTITGTVVGIWRWRFARPYRNGSRTPYPTRTMRWHHVSGLLFAVITFTWIFSGLMSMNPWRVLDSGAPPLQTSAMHEGALRASGEFVTPASLLQRLPPGTRELRWVRSVGHDIVVAARATGASRTLDARSGTPWHPDEKALVEAARRLVPGASAQVETIAAYDLYYYRRAPHTMTGGGEKPLPVVRVAFDDPHATWVHVDPATGLVVDRLDDMRRFSRWAFAMLHSWDWLPLLDRRPLWDIVLVVLSVGGLALSGTGVVIGWLRLRRPSSPLGRRRPQPVPFARCSGPPDRSQSRG